MNLSAVPASSDNDIRIIDDGRRAIVVDPGEAEPVQAAPGARRLALAAILVTRPSPDRVGTPPGRAAVAHGAGDAAVAIRTWKDDFR